MLKKIFRVSTIAVLSLAAVSPLKASIITETASSSTGDYSLNDILGVAITISNWILGIVGSLTLLMFVYGGVTMIISAGSSEKVSRGKEIIKNAIIGLVIVFASYTIIQFALSAMGFDNTNKFFTTGGDN